MKVFSMLSFVSASVIDVTDTNWRQIMEGEWLLEFSAPWCPACQRFELGIPDSLVLTRVR